MSKGPETEAPEQIQSGARLSTHRQGIYERHQDKTRARINLGNLQKKMRESAKELNNGTYWSAPAILNQDILKLLIKTLDQMPLQIREEVIHNNEMNDKIMLRNYAHHAQSPKSSVYSVHKCRAKQSDRPLKSCPVDHLLWSHGSSLTFVRNKLTDHFSVENDQCSLHDRR
jgi:hypothetical protein